MKTFFTSLLIFFISLSCYPQKATSINPKNTSQTQSLIAENLIFSINKTYPNPVKDFINIELQSDVASAIHVSLINILGVEVKQWDGLLLIRGEQKLRIDLTSIKTGLYFLRISQSDQVRTLVLKKI